MNFLAHALLGAARPALRVGGVAGDFVKGPLPAGLPPDLALGVALHRAIDGFADRHPAFIASRRRVGELRRRYAGVLADMFYDHLLARHWERFAELPLAEFAGETYRLVTARADELPVGFGRAFASMVSDDWLCSYRQPERVAAAIDRMSRHRIRRANPLAGGIAELFAAERGFEQDFLDFFPDALSFAARWSEDHPSSG